jgi:hypothetical protein
VAVGVEVGGVRRGAGEGAGERDFAGEVLVARVDAAVDHAHRAARARGGGRVGLDLAEVPLPAAPPERASVGKPSLRSSVFGATRATRGSAARAATSTGPRSTAASTKASGWAVVARARRATSAARAARGAWSGDPRRRRSSAGAA